MAHSAVGPLEHLHTENGRHSPANGHLCTSVIDYLTLLGTKLAPFESCLNESAIERELFATENETPNLDLLTCSSALTSPTPTALRPLNRHKECPNSGTAWMCSGRYNPSLGLGPLAELFDAVHERRIHKAQGSKCHNQRESPLSAASPVTNNSLNKQIVCLSEKDSPVESTPEYHFSGRNLQTVDPRRDHPRNSGKLTGSIFQFGGEHLAHKGSLEPGTYQEVPPNYETEYYNQNELSYLASFGISTNQAPLYSPQEDWYNQTSENLTKYNGSLVNMRVNNYVTNEYSLNPTGSYY